MHACTHMFALFPAQATPTRKMAWKSALLALMVCCSNASAFVMPLGSRAELNIRAAQLPSREARPSTRCNSTPPNMRYVAMNRFKVKLGCEEEFETMWRERESKLDSVSGFEQFMLLRLDTREADKKEEEEEEEGGTAARKGYTEFVSHTIWAHQMDFEEWKRSQAFKKSHGGGGGEGKSKGEGGSFVVAAGGMGKIRELIVEPPVPALYNAPIVEPVPPEHQGGLWDFEDEPSYFDGDM